MDARHSLGRGLAATEGTDEFFMFRYKILTCPRRYSHDWTSCPYAHSGESARRRDPSLYRPIPCPESKSGRPCPRGESCKYAHNDFEYWLHPTRYCTEYCKQGPGCKRKVCFFAHKPCELRKPADIISTLHAHGWLATPERRGMHERKGSTSSVESSDTTITTSGNQPGTSFGPFESTVPQGSAALGSPCSYLRDLDLTLMSASACCGVGSSILPEAAGSRLAEGLMVQGGVPARGLKYAGGPDGLAGFVAEAYQPIASVATGKQMVIDEVTSALAGCNADTSVLESVDPGVFLASSAGPSPRKPARTGSMCSPATDQLPPADMQNEDVMACLRVLVDKLQKGEGKNAAAMGLRAGGRSAVREGRVHGPGLALPGHATPKTTRLDCVCPDRITAATSGVLVGLDSPQPGTMRPGFDKSIPSVDELVLNQLLQAAANDSAGGCEVGVFHPSAFGRAGQCGSAAFGRGQMINGREDLHTSDEIITSLETNLEDRCMENQNLISMGGAAPFSCVSFPLDLSPVPSVHSRYPDASPPRVETAHVRRRSVDVAQLAASNWEVARSLGLTSLPSTNAAVTSTRQPSNMLGAALCSIAAGTQSHPSAGRQESGLESRTLDELVFGVPEGLPLCS